MLSRRTVRTRQSKCWDGKSKAFSTTALFVDSSKRYVRAHHCAHVGTLTHTDTTTPQRRARAGGSRDGTAQSDSTLTFISTDLATTFT